MPVNRSGHRAVAGHVDEHRWCIAREGTDAVVEDDAIVATEALDEGGVARRGQSDHLTFLPAVQEEGETEGGLARGAGKYDGACAEEGAVGQEVVE